jgi:tricorn protease
MLAFRIILFVLIIAIAKVGLADDTRLLRFPDIHEDRVVFVYAGDLYIASTDGGAATRLTSHAGLEQL